MLSKKCKKCNTPIQKISNFFDIFTLKSGRIIKCPHCHTQYQTNKIIRVIGKIYNELLIQIPILIILIVLALDTLKFNLGGEVWLYSIVLYILMEFIIMSILPLKEIKNGEE